MWLIKAVVAPLTLHPVFAHSVWHSLPLCLDKRVNWTGWWWTSNRIVMWSTREMRQGRGRWSTIIRWTVHEVRVVIRDPGVSLCRRAAGRFGDLFVRSVPEVTCDDESQLRALRLSPFSDLRPHYQSESMRLGSYGSYWTHLLFYSTVRILIY